MALMSRSIGLVLCLIFHLVAVSPAKAQDPQQIFRQLLDAMKEGEKSQKKRGHQTYQIVGTELGEKVNFATNHQGYTCAPSESYPGLSLCKQFRQEQWCPPAAMVSQQYAPPSDASYGGGSRIARPVRRTRLEVSHTGDTLLVTSNRALRTRILHRTSASVFAWGEQTLSDVFIPYAPEDRALAEAWAKDLQQRGFGIWLDTELVASDNFQDVTLTALSRAKAAIVIWTKASILSNFVRDEVRYALFHKKLIATKVAELDMKGIPFGFQSQYTKDVLNIEKLGVQQALCYRVR